LPRSFPSRSEIPGFIREERSNDGGGGSRRKTAMPRHDRCRDRFPPALKYLVSSGKNVPMTEAEVHVGRQRCLATIVAAIVSLPL
jgi:hypothetical protein